MRFIVLLALALSSTAALAQQKWDFSVIPTQVVDGTGNLACNGGSDGLTDGTFIADPNKWCYFYNTAITQPNQTLQVSAGVDFTLTSGITFSRMRKAKTILFRNYPENNGGMHLYVKEAFTMYLPAKTGDKIVLICYADKSRTISSTKTAEATQQVPRSDNGAEYHTLVFTVTDDTPDLTFQPNVYVQSITIEPASTGIAVIPTARQTSSDVYNLMGQRVLNPVRGQVYVRNGRKFLAK